MWTAEEETEATSTPSESQGCPVGARDELMAPWSIQAETANHSGQAGLSSKLSSLNPFPLFKFWTPFLRKPCPESVAKIRLRRMLVITGTSMEFGPHAGTVLSSCLEFTLFSTLSDGY